MKCMRFDFILKKMDEVFKMGQKQNKVRESARQILTCLKFELNKNKIKKYKSFPMQTMTLKEGISGRNMRNLNLNFILSIQFYTSIYEIRILMKSEKPIKI